MKFGSGEIYNKSYGICKLREYCATERHNLF